MRGERSAGRPAVLVVDADPAARRLFRTALALEGARMVGATTAEEGGRLLELDLAGVVVERRLPDDDGAVLAADATRRHPGLPVVLVDSLCEEDPPLPTPVTVARKDDVTGVVDGLGLPGDGVGDVPVASQILLDEVDDVAADWRALCRWDPLLPPDVSPPVAPAMIAAVAEALRHPQPLGWGPDPAVEPVAEVFAILAGSAEAAAEELVCLHEAVRRTLAGRVPPDQAAETSARLQMVIDRAIVVAVQRAVARLQEEAFVDPLTGLPNRRAFDRDLHIEVARAERYGRAIAVVVLDVDGLKGINDSRGHHAGDRVLRALAGGLTDALRASDGAYRLGGDEFALLLPETGPEWAQAVVARVAEAGAPRFSWGVATLPDDGDDPDTLVIVADRRLYEHRAGRRGRLDPAVWAGSAEGTGRAP